MAEPPTDAMRTRLSLLDRVKNLDDDASWREFFLTYDRLVRSLARRRGLGEHEAEDVAQEVFKRVAQTIHSFEHVQRPGAFRKWLGKLTRWRADDKVRERQRQREVVPLDDDERTPTIERVPAPPDPLLEFESEARRHLIDTLFKRLEATVSPKHLQIFHMLVVEGADARVVSELYGISTAHLYVIKHRIVQKLRDEARTLPLDWD